MSFVDFIPDHEPPTLTGESAQSLRDRLDGEHNFGGLSVRGVGRFISDHMPVGIGDDQLWPVAEGLAEQVGCTPVANSIMSGYHERAARQQPTV